MIEFKKPLEIFRVNADATFELGKGVDPLVALGELSKAFIKQQDRIKRLDDIIKHQEKVIKRLEDVEYRLMQERITD